MFYGKIGTAGSVKAKEFETEEECMKEANKLVASKRKKGYTDPLPGEDYIKEKNDNRRRILGATSSCKNER